MRNWRNLALASVLITVGQLQLAAAQNASTTAPSPTNDVMQKVLPEVKFDAVGLGDAINFLEDVAPGFTVVTATNEQLQSHVITMHMKHVTLLQVVSAIQATYPSLHMHPLGDGNDASIYIIEPETPAPDQTVALHIFRLAPAIQALMAANTGVQKEKPLDDVLSLIQVALVQVPGASQPLVQVHEGTQTLLFKGNAEQLQAVQDVMSAIEPTPREREDFKAAETQRVLIQGAAEIERLRAELDELHGLTGKPKGDAPVSSPTPSETAPSTRPAE
jgi:hypothetical protein